MKTLLAHVISGVAEKGRFAESGELADLAEILLQVPIYASLKQADPKLFEVFLGAVLQERQDGDGAEEILSSAGEVFGEVIDRLLPHAPDPLGLEQTSINLGYMDKLKSVDPESCAALAGGNGAQLKTNLNKQFPKLSIRENAFRESLIVSTDPDRPVPTESEVEPHLTEVFTKIRERFGDDANLLSKDTLSNRPNTGDSARSRSTSIGKSPASPARRPPTCCDIFTASDERSARSLPLLYSLTSPATICA